VSASLARELRFADEPLLEHLLDVGEVSLHFRLYLCRNMSILDGTFQPAK